MSRTTTPKWKRLVSLGNEAAEAPRGVEGRIRDADMGQEETNHEVTAVAGFVDLKETYKYLNENV